LFNLEKGTPRSSGSGKNVYGEILLLDGADIAPGFHYTNPDDKRDGTCAMLKT
jgi:hypothetical protein